MTHLIEFLFSLIASSARTRLSLQLEVAALRHQLSLYQAERRKPQITSSDRLLWSLVRSRGPAGAKLCTLSSRGPW